MCLQRRWCWSMADFHMHWKPAGSPRRKWLIRRWNVAASIAWACATQTVLNFLTRQLGPMLTFQSGRLLPPKGWDAVRVFYEVLSDNRTVTRSVLVKRLPERGVRSSLSIERPNSSSITVGDATAIPECWRCQHVSNYERGSEMDALQHLYEHCLAHPLERVGYVHSNLNYSLGIPNNSLWEPLTKAVFYKDCVTMPKVCNLCSASFSPQPRPHAVGNAWAARCEYINYLRPPADFETAMLSMANNTIWNHIRTGQTDGLAGQHPAEAWVASHPIVAPCDLYGGPYGYINATVFPSAFRPQVHIAPRFPVDAYDIDRVASTNAGYATLDRLLYEWTFLYSWVPPPTSFWWRYYGLGANGKVPTPPSTPSPALPARGWELLHVFYHIFNQDQHITQFIVDEQLSVLRQSHSAINRINVSYITVGHTMELSGCRQCRHLAHYEQGSEMLTLQHLFEHCRANLSKQVVYMHTKGSFHPTYPNTRLRHFLTKAIFSKECMVMPQTCNVCSSRFSSLPHPHVPGNMWLATCEYISQLLPPSTFEAAMSAMVRKSRAAPVPSRRPMEIGMHRYSAEHWLCSHPNVSPCDLYEGPYKYGYASIPDDGWHPNLQLAPRFPLDKYMIHRLGYTKETILYWRLYEWLWHYSKVPPASSFWWAHYALGVRRSPRSNGSAVVDSVGKLGG